jgi:signal transduction histidine kinase
VSIFGFSIAALMLIGCIVAYRFYKREQVRKQELATINATKDKLFSIIAHDLRAPIGTLKNYLELAEFGLMSQAQFTKVSEKLTNNVNALFQTLDNLLHWSYSQLKGIKAKPEKINLFEVANEELRFLDGIAQYKQIAIVNNVALNTTVFADRNQVGLAIRNIVSNSLKFTPSGGKIVLESQNTEGGKTTLKISDNGIGMSQDIQNQMFTIQENASRQGTASEKGQGLGLILVKDMIEANKGTLRVESVENQGTTVSIQLPIT